MIDKPTQETLYATAELRVKRSPVLAHHGPTIMADWPEGDAHWQWVATATVAEIVDWARTVEAEDPQLSTGDVARMVGVERRTVTGWCDQGRVAGATRTAGGHWRIPESSVDGVRGQ